MLINELRFQNALRLCAFAVKMFVSFSLKIISAHIRAICEKLKSNNNDIKRSATTQNR